MLCGRRIETWVTVHDLFFRCIFPICRNNKMMWSMQIHGHAVFLMVTKFIRRHINTIPCLPRIKWIIQHKETIKYCLLYEGETSSQHLSFDLCSSLFTAKCLQNVQTSYFVPSSVLLWFLYWRPAVPPCLFASESQVLQKRLNRTHIYAKQPFCKDLGQG